jgi:hypothetical protein
MNVNNGKSEKSIGRAVVICPISASFADRLKKQGRCVCLLRQRHGLFADPGAAPPLRVKVPAGPTTGAAPPPLPQRASAGGSPDSADLAGGTARRQANSACGDGSSKNPWVGALVVFLLVEDLVLGFVFRLVVL